MMKHWIAILALILVSDSCQFGPHEKEMIVDSNATHPLRDAALLDSTISRRRLSLPAFRTSEYSFQYLDEDEWGMYFKSLRIRYEPPGKIQLIEQDTGAMTFSVFEYLLSTDEVTTIKNILSDIYSERILYPDSSRHMVDGGDIGIVYTHKNKIFVRTWQENDRLPRNDKHRIDSMIDSISAFVNSKKGAWQR